MSNQWNTPIDKLMIWRKSQNWVRYESKSAGLNLRIHYDQLMITTEDKVLETFNVNNKLKGVYKDDVVVLLVSVTGQEIRKLKFQLKTDVMQCLYKLGEHFPVMNHTSFQSKNSVQSRYRNIDEVLRHALQNKEPTTPISLPSGYENFIKLCLLDPTFSQTVHETKKILEERIQKNN